MFVSFAVDECWRKVFVVLTDNTIHKQHMQSYSNCVTHLVKCTTAVNICSQSENKPIKIMKTKEKQGNFVVQTSIVQKMNEDSSE